jgi:hypothetical protein
MRRILFFNFERCSRIFVKKNSEQSDNERNIWEKTMEIKEQINELLGMLYNPVVKAKLNEIEETYVEELENDQNQ